ncbi:MAG: epoxyqueuosine reductase QueH [Clostridiales Family XIII bacterium]|jgi:predicted adenine nucleotide alpha hydrolase (AANH) superfamily ATPase|nr:epoxyqueuosine reductase QueH [Clostridiales Family XIII bacterium]
MNGKKRAYGAENTIDAGTFGARGAFERADGGEKLLDKPSLLLHSCCGPCSTSVVERLMSRYRVTIFFYNPNISDEEEYGRRRAAQLDFVERYNGSADKPDTLHCIEGKYDSEVFEAAIVGLETAPEGGARCRVCFRLRLEKTAETAVLRGFDSFATTLTVSPHKDCETIARIGGELALRYRVSYLAENFRKDDGYRRAVELSKRYGLYRQTYCGCRFSACAAERKAVSGHAVP